MQTWYLIVKEMNNKDEDKKWQGLITPKTEIKANADKFISIPFSSISFKPEDLNFNNTIHIDFLSMDESTCHQFGYCKNITKKNNQLSFSYAAYKFIG